jgi:hypothetical protein
LDLNKKYPYLKADIRSFSEQFSDFECDIIDHIYVQKGEVLVNEKETKLMAM